MAEPFFFPEPEAALFGVYHAPLTMADRDLGVVIAAPYGMEYEKTHRALRQLALQLAGAGFHVLRFDYRGCGDSAGEPTALDLADWVSDLEMAVEELEDRAGVARVAVVGLRLGATLALLAAARRRDVEALVLWEPILDGPAYMGELSDLAASWSHEGGFDPPPQRDETMLDVLGFPIGERLRRSLESLSFSFRRRPARRALLLLEAPRRDAGELSERLRKTGARAEELQVTPSGIWLGSEGDGRPVTPRATLQAAVSWLTAEGP